MDADGAVAHVAFEFGFGRERRDRVDDDAGNRARADEGVHDFERLFTGVGLGDQEFVEIDAQFFRVLGSSACSASTKAQTPPAFCASATTWRVSVVLPDDSGP